MVERLNRLAGLVLLCGINLAGLTAEGQTVYVSRMWHNHQPLYWPEWNPNGSQTGRVQYAWDSIVLKSGQTYGTGVGHPDNNLTEIFGRDGRRNAYQGRPRDALAVSGQDALSQSLIRRRAQTTSAFTASGSSIRSEFRKTHRSFKKVHDPFGGTA